METERFDALATRFARRLSRRRALGVLGLGSAGLALTRGAADARKHHKHKHKPHRKTTGAPQPQCPACGPCETCVNFACAPQPDHTTCGDHAVCLRGQCTFLCGATNHNATCEAAGGQCSLPYDDNTVGWVCVQEFDYCNAPDCGSISDCAADEICVGNECNEDGWYYCGTPVAP